MSDKGIPPDLRRLWRLPSGSVRGRPASLSVDIVVQAAVDLADDAGLAAVSLPKLAAVLGVTTMSLYKYVGSASELYVLMGDLASGRPPACDSDDESWRDGLWKWAHAQIQVYAAHPWLSQLPVTSPPGGPNAISWMDGFLAAMCKTGLDAKRKLAILAMLGNYVRSFAQVQASLDRGRTDKRQTRTETELQYSAAMAALVDPAEYPHAAQLFRGEPFESNSDSSRVPGEAYPEFRYGLTIILDGIAAAIEEHGQEST
ncbi:TetR/AcrR family transcriptional regulator [Nonomuraea sp. NPDC050663]|uniref:TetR/AcrR family transcriptional regulator n=1 Tax=Nonomuraea sp. NPDC050663 TaxID=3364370 RepID=UPI0037892464